MVEHLSTDELVGQIALKLKISVEDINAVIYGEPPLSNESLRLSIIDTLGDDGRGVFLCVVWKGNNLADNVRHMPRYDYFGQIIEGLNLYLYKKGYTSRLLVSNARLADEGYFEHIISKYPTAGFINLASNNVDTIQKVCKQFNRPIIYLDYPVSADPHNQYIISMDGKSVFKEVVEHLYQLGHRRIAFIQGPQLKQTAVDRYQGYLDGLHSVNLEIDEQVIYAGNWQEHNGISAAERFLELSVPPTAIIASNDLMAFGAMKRIQERGLRIPDDISIVGFDDIASASMTKPPLASVRTLMTQIGRQAGDCIVKLLEGKAPMPYHTFTPVEFVVRESVGRAPQS